jgi:hypothetical protein
MSTHVGAPIEAPNRAGTGWRKISDAMDCRATGLYTASFPGKAGLSRRYDGLRDRIYREAAVRAGLLAHREYAPAVMRGLTDEQRKALDAASAAALHCEAGGAEPPWDAVRVVDNVRTTRPDLLLHTPHSTRGSPVGRACLSFTEVKSIAFGMSRYSIRWHLDGATWTQRNETAVKKGNNNTGDLSSVSWGARWTPPPHVRKCHQMSSKEHIQLDWVVRWVLSTPPGHPTAGRCVRVVPVLPLLLCTRPARARPSIGGQRPTPAPRQLPWSPPRAWCSRVR